MKYILAGILLTTTFVAHAALFKCTIELEGKLIYDLQIGQVTSTTVVSQRGKEIPESSQPRSFMMTYSAKDESLLVTIFNTQQYYPAADEDILAAAESKGDLMLRSEQLQITCLKIK